MPVAEDAQEVLDFWFGTPDSPTYGERNEAWFKKDPAFDAQIRARFLPLWERAHAVALRGWDDGPQALLAYIVVCDQFPRNMFRGEPRSYATDARALAAARTMVARHWDGTLMPVARGFAYLPFEHSESLCDQADCLALFRQWRSEPVFQRWDEFVVRHYAIIRRFGRFPHRNAVLGRRSTPEEIEFLKEPGSSF
jgi:uncharacterized protein (DUF924 family)